MKRILLPLVAALAVFLAPTAKAQYQVDWASLGNQILLNDNSTFDPDGSTILLGHFDSSFTFSLTDTFALLMSHFTTYASTTIGSGGAPPGGGQFNATNLLPNSTGVAGDQMFIWVFNLTNTQWTILTSNAANWTRPPDASNTVIDTSETSVFVPNGVIGSIVGGNLSGGNINLGVAPIPEPSTYLLGLVGGGALLGALRLRRARSVK
jgi:hypothetical protein